MSNRFSDSQVPDFSGQGDSTGSGGGDWQDPRQRLLEEQQQMEVEYSMPDSDFAGDRRRPRVPQGPREIVMDRAFIEIGPNGLRIIPDGPVRGQQGPDGSDYSGPPHRRNPDGSYPYPDRNQIPPDAPYPPGGTRQNPTVQSYPWMLGPNTPEYRLPMLYSPGSRLPGQGTPRPDVGTPRPDAGMPRPDAPQYPGTGAPRPDAPQYPWTPGPYDRNTPDYNLPYPIDSTPPWSNRRPPIAPPLDGTNRPGGNAPGGNPGDQPAGPGQNPIPKPGEQPKPTDPPKEEPPKVPPVDPNKPGGGSDITPPTIDPTQPPTDTKPPSGTPPADTKPPESEADKLKAKMSAAAEELNQKHNDSFEIAQEALKDQGIIGQSFDSMKNTIGTTGEGKAWYNPGRWWSGLFDSDLGSNSVKKSIDAEAGKITKLQEAAAKGDEASFKPLYKEITGQDFDPNRAEHTPKSSKLAAEYDSSQRAGVDTITDVSSALVTAVALRSGKGAMASSMARAMGSGAVVGGVTKASLMQVDGRYADLKRDAAIGALWGAGMPIGEAAGAGLSRVVGNKYGMAVTGNFLTGRIETMGMGMSRRLLSASVKSGTSGAVFGGLEAPTRHTIQSVSEGKAITASDLLTKSIQGTAFGFVGGTAFGMVFDGVGDVFKSRRPPAMDGPTPKKVNGVDVPTSGAASIDDVAKMTGQKPTDFAKKAVENPYGAVDDAVQLYEKHGVNVKKYDSATGASTLPPEFDNALTTVQKVDALTADAKTGLREKVKIVKAADEFVNANAQEVEASMTRIKADKNYQEVVRLKTEQGGAQAADQFEQSFRTGFEKDLKTGMSVERVHNPGLDDAAAFGSQKPKTESAYIQKAADFFKDMTDPTQRARLNTLVDDIFNKFNPEGISKKQLADIFDQVPQGDRELAYALLAESAGSSSDVILKARLQALRQHIQSTVGSVDDVYTLSPSSSGNMLGYLYRKSNSMSMSMSTIDNLFDQLKKGHSPPQSIMIFDDLASTPLSQEQKALLAKVPNVYVVDLGAFEKGINVLDVARGPQAVAKKLDVLLAEAREVAAQNNGLISTGVAREVLGGSVDQVAASIGPNVKVVRLAKSPNVPNLPSPEELSKMAPTDAVHAVWNVPKASKEEIATFLSKYAGEEREIAAKMLAEGAVHNSFGAMMGKAVQVYDQLAGALQKSGMNMDDLLLVSDKDPGGSTHLITYLFGQANGMSANNFISARRLDQLITSGGAKGKAIAYFDDTVYSGSQAASMLDSNVSSLMPFKKVVIGSLGAYEKGISKLRGTHLASLGKVEVATASVHQPFYSSKHPFYSSLSPQAQSAVKNIGGSAGFGDVQGSLIWSYMYPDNNLDFFGSGFSGKVLHLPGP